MSRWPVGCRAGSASPAIAALAAVLLLLPVSACRTLPETLRPLPAGDPRPAALLLELGTRFEARRALRAQLRMAVDGPAGSGRSRLRLAAARPARLRVEVRGLFGETLALLVTDGHRYILLAPGEGRQERGPVYDGLLLEAAGLDLRPEEAVSLLLAVPPVERGARPRGAVALGDGGLRFSVEGARGDSFAELEFDRFGRIRRWIRRSAAGDPVFEVAFLDWRDDPGEAFPFRREVVFPATGTRASLDFRRVELLRDLPAALFEVEGTGGVGGAAAAPGPAKLPDPGCPPGSAGGGECGSGAS